MEVTMAGPADAEHLTGLRMEYLAEDLGPLSSIEAEALRARLPDYFHRHLGTDLFCPVIREGSGIAACAFLLVEEKPMSPAFPNGKTGVLLNVYTRPDFRRRGYAAAVLREVLAAARRLQLCRIELKATDAGYSLYRSLGFADAGSRYRPMVWTPPQDTRGTNAGEDARALELRPYEDADAAVILSWPVSETAFYKWTAGVLGPYPLTEERFGRLRMASRFTLLDGGVPAGFFTLRRPEDDPAAVRFGFVIVDPAKRGRGYGREMLRLGLLYARSLPGVRRATLAVFENNEPAWRCYRAAGFRDLDLPEPETYTVLGETWRCRTMEAGL